jgi:hypothetical protein
LDGKRRTIALVLGLLLVALVPTVAAVTHLPTQSGNSATSTSSTSSSTFYYDSISPCNCTVTIPQPKVYQNLSALESNSLLIVVANISSALTIGVPSQNPQVNSTAVVPVTYYNFTVIETLEDSGGIATSGTIVLSVVQIGGIADGTNMSVNGYPTLAVGGTYVLFLAFPGTFFVDYYEYRTANTPAILPSFITVGGPQGLFYIQQGDVYSLNNMYPQVDSWLPVTADGVPLAQFASEVQAAATTTTSSSDTSTTSSSSTTSDMSYAFAVRPCNCSVDFSQKAWPQYDTLGALASASITVVVANVTSEDTVGVNDSALFGGNVGLVPVTDYNVTVSTVISGGGYGLEPGYWLVVPQVGGTLGHTSMNVTGYPTLSVGRSYVFFLTTQAPIEIVYGGSLTTTGAAQGLFYIQGGDVYSLNNMYPQTDSWLPVKAAGVPLDQFISEVQSAASSTTTATSNTSTSTQASSSSLYPSYLMLAGTQAGVILLSEIAMLLRNRTDSPAEAQ